MSSLFLWRTWRLKSPRRVQWFMASNAMRVSRRSIAVCVICASCTQWGHPHRTRPSGIAVTSAACGLGSSRMSAEAITSARSATRPTRDSMYPGSSWKSAAYPRSTIIRARTSGSMRSRWCGCSGNLRSFSIVEPASSPSVRRGLLDAESLEVGVETAADGRAVPDIRPPIIGEPGAAP